MYALRVIFAIYSYIVSLNVVCRSVSIDVTVSFFLNKKPDALIIQIYSVIKLYIFRASCLPIIRSFPLYIRYW